MATKPNPPPSGRSHKQVAGFAKHAASPGRFVTVSHKDAPLKGRELRTTLKKAGGSLVMTVPAGARDALNLSAGQEMEIVVIDNTMVLQAAKPARPKYTLDELLAECDFDAPYSDEERAWLDDAPVGREQMGPHFVLIISPRAFNKGGVPLVCPITTIGNSSRMRGFAVNLSGAGTGVTVVIQVDQLSALDMLARKGKASGDVVPDFIMDEVLAKIATIAQ